MGKGRRNKRGSIDWDSGRWVKDEWRPQQQGLLADDEDDGVGPTTTTPISKQRRQTVRLFKSRRSPPPTNKDGQDDDDSDSIDDALFWEEKQRLFWKEEEHASAASSSDAPKVVATEATKEDPPPLEDPADHDPAKINSSNLQQDTIHKTNSQQQQQQDPTESTELASSGSSSQEGPSLEMLVNNELDDIQQQLEAIERKLSVNQIQLKECLDEEEEEESAVQIFEDNDDEKDETGTAQRKKNALLIELSSHSHTGEEELFDNDPSTTSSMQHNMTPTIAQVGSAEEEDILSLLTEDGGTTVTAEEEAEDGSNIMKSDSKDDDAGKSLPQQQQQQQQRRRRRKSSSNAVRRTQVAAALSTLLDTIIQSSDTWMEASSATTMHDTFAQKVVQQLERMLDRFVRVMEGLEIMLSFGGTNNQEESNDDTMDEAQRTIDTIAANYAPLLVFIWEHQLHSALQQYWNNDPEDPHLMDLLYRIALLLKGLAMQFKDLFLVQKRPPMELESNADVKAIFVTFFELLRRDAWAVTILSDSTKTPKVELSAFRPSIMLQLAWNVNDGDNSEWQNLFITTAESEIPSWEEGMQHFRGLCCDWIMRSSSSNAFNLLGSSLVELLLEYSDLDSPDEQSSESDSATSSELGSSSGEQSESDSSDTEELDVHYWVQEPPLEVTESSRSPVLHAAGLVLKAIQGDPQPRDYLFEEILSQLITNKSSTGNNDELTRITLYGGACVGKTTLAAMIAYTPLVHKFFSGGIVWIGLTGRAGEGLRYDQYIMCLYDILDQLGFNRCNEKDFLKFPEHMHVPGETPAERARRENHLLSVAKATMAEFLRGMRVVFILDNVRNLNDLSLFEFEGVQGALLVTTRFSDLVSELNGVEVGTLQSEEEALELLASECNTCTDCWDGTSLESEAEAASSLALKCCFHPMAMALLGRFLHLQGQQAGMKGKLLLAPTDRILASFGRKEECEMLFSVLNMSLSSSSDGVMTTVFNLSLVAFVKVFCSEDTPGFSEVPSDIVELLLESILVLEKENFQEEIEVLYQHKERAAELIVYVLTTLGVLSHTKNSQKITLGHSIYKEYVDCLLDVDAAVRHFADPSNQQKWHRAIVANLLDNVRHWHGTQLDYALRMLPHHMICAQMYMEAADLVADLNFVNARIRNMGLTEATKRQIKDTECLLAEIVPGSSTADTIHSRSYYRVVIQQAYTALLGSAPGTEHAHDPCDVAGALVDVGVSLSEWYCYEDAISFWSRALATSALPTSVKSVILLRIGAAYAELNDFGDQKLEE